jgi:hypothetical protein
LQPFVFETMRHPNVNHELRPALPAFPRDYDLARVIEVASVKRSRERQATD